MKKLLANADVKNSQRVTDHLIPARRPDLIIINKKKENLQNCRLCCPGGLEDYIEKYERGLITAIRNDTDNSMDNRITITRKQKWKEQLYGRFKRLINKISHEKTWKWTRRHEFKSWTRLIAFHIALIPLGKV